MLAQQILQAETGIRPGSVSREDDRPGIQQVIGQGSPSAPGYFADQTRRQLCGGQRGRWIFGADFPWGEVRCVVLGEDEVHQSKRRSDSVVGVSGRWKGAGLRNSTQVIYDQR